MKSRAILGKRVVAVRQKRATDPNRKPVTHIEAIEFDDGTLLTFTVSEQEADYAIVGLALKNGKRIG